MRESRIVLWSVVTFGCGCAGVAGLAASVAWRHGPDAPSYRPVRSVEFVDAPAQGPADGPEAVEPAVIAGHEVAGVTYGARTGLRHVDEPAPPDPWIPPLWLALSGVGCAFLSFGIGGASLLGSRRAAPAE